MFRCFFVWRSGRATHVKFRTSNCWCVLLCLKIMSYFNFQPKDGSPEPLIPASFPPIPHTTGACKIEIGSWWACCHACYPIVCDLTRWSWWDIPKISKNKHLSASCLDPFNPSTPILTSCLGWWARQLSCRLSCLRSTWPFSVTFMDRMATFPARSKRGPEDGWTASKVRKWKAGGSSWIRSAHFAGKDGEWLAKSHFFGVLMCSL